MKILIKQLLKEHLNYSQLIIDINNFLKLQLNDTTKYGDLLNSCDLAKGNCDTVSNALYQYLLSIGYNDSRLANIDLFIPKFETNDAHPEWKKINKKFLVHSMLKVDEVYVDLTGSQYSPKQSGVKIYTKEDLRKLWSHYKIMKKDKNGNYIGGSSTNAGINKL